MRGLALNPPPSPSTAAPFHPARLTFTKEIHSIMKALETVISIISFILLAIVLFALSPLLIKLIEMANHLNHFFGN